MNPQSPETPQPQQPTPQPVAYDANGQPLYAHPPVAPQPQAPQVVQTMRPLEPAKPEISPEIRERHEKSRQRYPFLNLSEGEYVIKAVRRHPIGLFIPMAAGVILLTLALTILVGYESIADSLGLVGAAADPAAAAIPVLLFCVLIGLGMFVAYYVYVNNKFFLTNESVVQEIQHSLFSRHEQTVSLGSIEDASFVQTNIIQHLFNYGSIRLSTEGDETTYRFTFVANPKEHIATLNNAVEAFKLGRPVDDIN
jgi:uncharacterized membrane protein YdbT with pleckstrin-like domain